ncbi:hypothetical protein E3N88_34408 [Mikania micrantha]|uniref:Uncharacterized protein n=1 Tax=Mikania micrantha TaxID=192012 RepID=A0A5N6LY72_9ASTR|nr:hypothetical protein E3N88_34408 [Mikania micrantha]
MPGGSINAGFGLLVRVATRVVAAKSRRNNRGCFGVLQQNTKTIKCFGSTDVMVEVWDDGEIDGDGGGEEKRRGLREIDGDDGCEVDEGRRRRRWESYQTAPNPNFMVFE